MAAAARPRVQAPASTGRGRSATAKPRRPAARLGLLACFVTALCLVATGPAAAQRTMSFIRDAEIEWVLRQYTDPLLQSAGLAPAAVSLFIVEDSSLNAFVAGGQNIFIHTGTILESTAPEELIGVIAHEIGHISGGHIARGTAAMDRARITSLVTTLLGAAAGVAAGRPDVGMAGIMAGQSVATRDFLTFTRAMENAADQAALRYLERNDISAEGLLRFLELLGDQDLLPASQQVEYVRTHPLTPDRVDSVRAHVAQSPHTGQPMSDWAQESFRRMQAKLLGFLDPRTALRVYGADDQSMAARYGRAIALYRTRQVDEALAILQSMVTVEPDNPFFQELIGQILLERGRLAEARPYYERAVALFPDAPLLLVPLAQIKLETGDPADRTAAIADLQRATRDRDAATPTAWRLLATAYGQDGDTGMAALALAEEALARGDETRAMEQATRAQQQLARGTPGWLRAEDILSLR